MKTSYITQTANKHTVCHCLPRETEPFLVALHCLQVSQIVTPFGKQCSAASGAIAVSSASSGTLPAKHPFSL